MIDLLIVTGPLGAGKTTTVNRLLKGEVEAGRRVAVLINEFGAVSVDGALVGAERPEVAGIANLVNGCVCCSLREDVVATLAAWADQEEGERPHRVVLETTGLADPTDLMDLPFDPSLRDRIRLRGVLTVLSCLTPLDHLAKRDLLRRQVALASLVHLTKGDLDPSAAAAWEGELRTARKGLPLVPTRHGEAPAGSPDPWDGDPMKPEGWTSTGTESFADTRSLHLDFDHPVDPEALEALFGALREGALGIGELLRAKGVCAFAGWPPRADGSDRWAFQVADGRIEISPLPLLPEDRTAPAMAVLIGTGLDHGAWKTALRGLERPAVGARKRVVIMNRE